MMDGMRGPGSASSEQPIPQVRRDAPQGEWTLDIFSSLLSDRIVVLGEPVVPEVANVVMAQLLHLEADDPDKDIALYINAPGGDPASALALLDTMEYVRCDVATFCFGQAVDVAAVILAAGAAGKRLILPHARVVLTQLQTELQGQSVDLETQAKEMLRLQELFTDLLAERTGRDPALLRADTDRALVLTASQAQQYGLVDVIVDRRGA